MCGGGDIDLTNSINSATGDMKVVCQNNNTNSPTNSTDCNLNFSFLASLLPNGVDLVQCKFGECADSYSQPELQDKSSNSRLDAFNILAIIVFGLIITILTSTIIFLLADRGKRRGYPQPKEYPSVSLEFKEITYSIRDKVFLSSITGSVNPGEILAIMGPSGSGKSTLLDILARRQKSGLVSGLVTINKLEIHQASFSQISGFVDQDDLHLPLLTVREVLEFSAALRLPESLSTAKKSERVDVVLRELGLTGIQNSRIGTPSRRGISGGEKRRLSIGVELVTNPSIIFMDEPTSGLDSFNAQQVIKTLSTLAKNGRKTPNSSIFALFDRILVLSRGKVAYFGHAGQASAFCSNQGSPCPSEYHIADHLLDFASESKFKADTMDVQGLRLRKQNEKPNLKDDLQIFELAELKKFSQFNVEPFFTGVLTQTTDQINPSMLGSSFITQLYMILIRSWKVSIRNPKLIISHLILSACLGIFIGVVYYHVDATLGGIQNRLGSIFFMQACLAFAGLSSISSLESDRLLFVRERANGFYGWAPYFIQKILFDAVPLRIIPAIIMTTLAYFLIGFNSDPATFFRFLLIMVIFSVNGGLYCLAIGCGIGDASTSTLAASISILFQMLFAGILVNQVQIPSALRWIQYTSFFKYAYEACVANDARGLRLTDMIAGVEFVIPASAILAKFGLDVDAYYRDLVVCIGLTFIFLTIIALLMKYKLRERK